MPFSRRARVVSWSFYDFANTIFSMNVVSLYFPLWVTQDMGGRDIHYSLALSLSMVAAGLTMPVIGAYSDQRRRRMPLLVGLTLVCVAFTAAIPLADGLVIGLLLFAAANYGYQTALVPYDALLPEVSGGVGVGRVSGLGVALGYAGTITGLYMVKPFVESGGRAAAFIPTAALFLLFALPAFFVIRDPAERPPRVPLGIKRTLRKNWITLKNTRRYPGLLRFLVANLIYSDAVNTIIVFMAVYASAVIGMDDGSIREFMVVSTLFAAAGSYAAGHLTDRLGPKTTLLLVLFLWAVTLALAASSFSEPLFWAVGPLAGTALGGTWVSSRALVVALTPPRKFGEVYGLYNLGGKFGYVIGPLVWGGTVLVLEPLGVLRYRVAVLTLAVFILAAIAVLWKLRVPRTWTKQAGSGKLPLSL